MSEQRPVTITAYDKLYNFISRLESCDYSEHGDFVKACELMLWQERAEELKAELDDSEPQPEREEAAAREFADGWRDAEVARLTSELEQEESDAALFLQSLAYRDQDVVQLEAEVARLREALESINSMVLDMPIKTGDKDAILDVVSAALASSDSEPDHK